MWVGLSDLRTKGVYRWTTSHVLSYDGWDSSQPDMQLDKRCVKMEKGKFKVESCSNNMWVLCQRIPEGKWLAGVVIGGAGKQTVQACTRKYQEMERVKL